MPKLLRNNRRYFANFFIWDRAPNPSNFVILQRISRLGFDGVEILSPETLRETQSYIQALKSTSKSSRKREPLDTIIIGASNFEADPSSSALNVQRRAIDHLKKCVDFSAKVEGDLIAGPVQSPVGENVFMTHEERKRRTIRAAETLKVVTGYAKDRGVKIAFEPLCRYDQLLHKYCKPSAHSL